MTVSTLSVLSHPSTRPGKLMIEGTPWYYLFGNNGLAYLKTLPLPYAEPVAPACADQQLVKQLTDYFYGRLASFTIPVAPEGTPFQQRVWEQLQHVPYGQTISYGELAKQLDQPAASRAVGSAVAKNPVWVVIPCHRVIGQQGALTGYAGGLPLKQQLLTLENAQGRGLVDCTGTDTAENR